MRIGIIMGFDELEAVSLLNWMAHHNARVLRRRPELPNLYESGVFYRREKRELWCDYPSLLLQGHEDCDGLSAARAGELMARGWTALSPVDKGYSIARRRKLKTIRAEVMLRTRTPPNQAGLYHCIVRYRVGRKWYRDDPSARLGMYERR